MVYLNSGKVIRRGFIHRFRTVIDPTESVDEYGMETTPKELRYYIVLDFNGYCYIIPGKFDDSRKDFVKCYEPEDIVEAALGDVQRKALIDTVNKDVRKYCANRALFTEEWSQFAYTETVDDFFNKYCEFVKEKNLQLRERAAFPKTVKTVENFTKEELETVLATAVYPPKPTPSPFGG